MRPWLAFAVLVMVGCARSSPAPAPAHAVVVKTTAAPSAIAVAGESRCVVAESTDGAAEVKKVYTASFSAARRLDRLVWSSGEGTGELTRRHDDRGRLVEEVRRDRGPSKTVVTRSRWTWDARGHIARSEQLLETEGAELGIGATTVATATAHDGNGRPTRYALEARTTYALGERLERVTFAITHDSAGRIAREDATSSTGETVQCTRVYTGSIEERRCEDGARRATTHVERRDGARLLRTEVVLDGEIVESMDHGYDARGLRTSLVENARQETHRVTYRYEGDCRLDYQGIILAAGTLRREPPP